MKPIKIIESANKDDFELECEELYDQGYKLSSSNTTSHITKGIGDTYVMYHGVFECHDRYHKSHDAILNNKVIQEYEIKAILRSIIEKIEKVKKHPDPSVGISITHLSPEIALEQEDLLIKISKELTRITG